MPVSSMRIAAVAASVVFAGTALAQAQRPAQQRPAQQQPQQQQPQQPAQAPAGAPPAGPQRVDLQGSQAEWTKVCGKDQAANKEICYTTRDFGTDANQPPVLAVAVYDVKGDDQKVVRLLLPPALLLRPGFRFSVDRGATTDGAFEICFPNGCFAEAKVRTAAVDGIKKGKRPPKAVNQNIYHLSEVLVLLPFEGVLPEFRQQIDAPDIETG